MRPEPAVHTDADLFGVLDGILFRGTCNWGWKWRARELFTSLGEPAGWLLWAEFHRPEIDTPAEAVGATRQEFVAAGASESAVVKTAWVVFEMTVRHEAMEGFHYRGCRPFNPHHTVAELSAVRGPAFPREG